MKNILLCVLLLTTFTLNGQEKPDPKNSIGINLLGYQGFNEVVYNARVRMFLFAPLGVTYTRIGKFMDVRATGNYLSRTIDSDPGGGPPKLFADGFYGQGKVNGVEFKLGLQKEFRYRTVSVFGGLELDYLRTRYTGSYQGGFSGGGYSPDDLHTRYGISPNMGFGYYPWPRLRLSIETGGFIGRHFTQTKDGRNYRETQIDIRPIQAVNVAWKF